ncbi:MAG: hypothetical protein JXA79_13260 [Deltaproteobacteria bacterium]|nr:hypothetical protein [Deltaproteobacteria bacterium]
MASSHSMWINLRAKDLRSAYEAGKFPQDGWRVDSFQRESSSLAKSRKRLLQTFICAFVIILIVIIIAFFLKPDIEFKRSTRILFIGGAFFCWAVLYQIIGSPPETAAGITLNEVIHKMFFLILYVVGTFLTLAGLIM